MIRNTLLLIPLLALPLVPSAGVSTGATTLSSTLEDDTPLQEAMEVLKKGQRGLKKMMGDLATNQSALLTMLTGMEAATLKAMGETPLQPDGLSKKDAALFQLGYRHEMAKLLVQVVALQEATWRGDAAAFKAAYSELGSTKKAGHEVSRDF